MCDICIHKIVCSRYAATGGMKRCEHFKEEVVRCKDCDWWRGVKCKNAFGMVSFNENNFCSYGEKEETCQRNRQK